MKPHGINESATLWHCPKTDWHYSVRPNLDDWPVWNHCPGCGEAIPAEKRPVAIEAGGKT